MRKNVENEVKLHTVYTHLLTRYLRKKIVFISNIIYFKYFKEGKELIFIEIILAEAFAITKRQYCLILNSTRKSATKNIPWLPTIAAKIWLKFIETNYSSLEASLVVVSTAILKTLCETRFTHMCFKVLLLRIRYGAVSVAFS